MLILVLIPVVAAEDSSEAFYIEYAEETSDDVIVEESYSADEEVEYAQEHTFISNENDDVGSDSEDLSTDNNHFEEPVADNCDANIIEHVECSYDVSQNVQLNEDDVNYISSDNFADIIDEDTFENGDCELTTEDISVINQGSLFISKNDFKENIILITINLNTETSSFETTSFDRGITKILELKNSILISQDIRIACLNDVAFDVDSDIVDCINKATNDFAFSIDNSVVGDGYGILNVCNSCFLKFNPCFYAFVSCEFLTVDDFFGSDFLIAFKLFCDFAVEHSENDLNSDNFQEFYRFSGNINM